ncbi:hypothetical protein P3T23_006498 [Paraburkholderia sp. GAS448]|uniref:hypothetical protein n=1 Tax=Paraburkholderia sp. GAS448 TaxID=3035136 RepID=UPI003D1F8EA9
MNRALSDQEKREKAENFFANGPWYAACSTADNYVGPNRDTFDAAQKDADDHDNEKHGGENLCAVLDS